MAYEGNHPLPVPSGATGRATLTDHSVLVGAGTTAITQLGVGATGTVLIGLSAADPSFSATPSVTSMTVTDAPMAGTDAANKAYVDSVASGFTFEPSAFAATTANLNATYANGAAGVGATLTNAGAMVAFSVDGVSPAHNDRVLVKDQTNQEENGIYTLTTVGSGATNWVLTRATDYDSPAEITPGTVVPVTDGTLNAGTTWLEVATVNTVGTDPVIFSRFTGGTLTTFNTDAASATVSGGTITMAGGSNINTSGAGSTVTYNLNNSPAVSGSLAAGTTITAGTGITATTGNIAASAGNVTASGLISAGTSIGAGTTITAGTGLIATTGGLKLSNFIEGALVTSVTGVASSVTGTAGYVLTANAAGTAPSFQAPTTTTISITGDAGGALVGNAFTFTGGTTGITFTGAGSTETLGGTLVVANGGTGATTLTGILTGNGTGAVTATAITQHDVLVGGASNAITSIANGTTGQVFTATTGGDPSWAAPAASSISITGNTGGALVGSAFTFSGGTTGLSFGGAATTETLTFAGITANGGTVSLATDATTSTINVGTGAGIKTSTFGSTNSTSATTIQSGSGALNVTSTDGALTINSGIGTLGISTDASATTVNIATGAAAKTTTLGSTNTTSTTTIQAGSGAINLSSTAGTSLRALSAGYTGSNLVTKQASVQTTDATPTTLVSVAVADSQMVTIKAIINGFRSTYASSIGAEVLLTVQRSAGGNVAIVGTPVVNTNTNTTCDVTCDVNTGTQVALIKVTGVGAQTFNWVASYEYMYLNSNA